tara:strand:+ start:153 stop:1244 length:1092 start_codon:yes stop_codon:yes gene_type:complete
MSANTSTSTSAAAAPVAVVSAVVSAATALTPKTIAKKIKTNQIRPAEYKGYSGVSLYHAKIKGKNYDDLKSHRGHKVALAVVKTGLTTSMVCLVEEDTNRAGTKHFGYTIGRKKFPENDEFMKSVCCSSATTKATLITDLPGYFAKKSAKGNFTGGQYYNNATIGWVEGENATDETKKLAIQFIKNEGYDKSILTICDAVARKSNGSKKKRSAIGGFSRDHQRFYDNYTCSKDGDDWVYDKKEGGEELTFSEDEVAHATLVLTAQYADAQYMYDLGQDGEILAEMFYARRAEIEAHEASSGANKKLLAEAKKEIATLTKYGCYDKARPEIVAKYGASIVAKAEGASPAEVQVAKVADVFAAEM